MLSLNRLVVRLRNGVTWQTAGIQTAVSLHALMAADDGGCGRRQDAPDLPADTKIVARSSEGHVITIKR
eukprot:751224-Hanusia_phi.AAC.2